jgi:hypothetical protein
MDILASQHFVDVSEEERDHLHLPSSLVHQPDQRVHTLQHTLVGSFSEHDPHVRKIDQRDRVQTRLRIRVEQGGRRRERPGRSLLSRSHQRLKDDLPLLVDLQFDVIALLPLRVVVIVVTIESTGSSTATAVSVAFVDDQHAPANDPPAYSREGGAELSTREAWRDRRRARKMRTGWAASAFADDGEGFAAAVEQGKRFLTPSNSLRFRVFRTKL